MRFLHFISFIFFIYVSQLFSLDSIWTKDHFNQPNFEIGDWSYGVPKVLTWGTKSKLKIGKFCAIAQDVVIFLEAEHRTDWVSTYTFEGMWPECHHEGHPGTKGDVVIGNDVWIGYQAMILSGVKIGDGAVVGARSVVTKDVPPYAIVAGSPARVVRYRFSQSVIDKLLSIQWWNWSLNKVYVAIPYLTSGNMEEFFKFAEWTESIGVF
jgi:virginiamycin A acetyltransferase